MSYDMKKSYSYGVKCGETALMQVVKSSNMALVEALLDHGASVNENEIFCGRMSMFS
jgi:hypothetical protein